MSKASQRPGNEEIKGLKRQRMETAKALREKQKAKGLYACLPARQGGVKAALPNRKSGYENVKEERDARQAAATDQMRILKSQLPCLLKGLSKIKDPGNPKKIKHKLKALLIYGILMFVFQISSRCEANREMTRPQFIENLNLFFPEIDIPHNDTLMRLLSVIEVDEIEAALMGAVRKLIKNKKFSRYLVDNYYTVAIDGTQKFKRDVIWAVS